MSGAAQPPPAARELLAQAEALEPRFANITHCSRCEELLCGRIWKRMYSLAGDGVVLVVLCDPCNAAVPSGSAADVEFRHRLERMGALVKQPAQGRA